MQGRKCVIGDRHASLEAAVDVETGHHVRIETKLAGRHEDAVAGRRLDRDLVHHRVHIEERRCGRGLIQVVVRVRGACDAGRRNWRGRRRCVRQRAVGDRHASDVHVVRKVLARVADDAEAVGDGIEVDAERRPHQRNRQGVDELCLGRRRVNRVDAAAVSHAVQLPVLHAEVDADESGVVARETLHVADIPGSAR